jgi:hypothetical protein
MHNRPVFALCVLSLLTVAACDRPATEPPPPPKAADAPVTAKAAPELVATPATIGGAGESVVAEFGRRVKDYVAMREQLAGTLKDVPDRATPRQIDAHQRALLALVAKARSDAKVGDIFVPEMQTFVRGLVKRVLDGPEGAKVRASLMDENPVGAKVEVNGRYPDTVPMSTMPPDVLAALPALPDDMEYRFVGDRLILLDVKAHIIVDYVANAIAGKE